MLMWTEPRQERELTAQSQGRRGQASPGSVTREPGTRLRSPRDRWWALDMDVHASRTHRGEDSCRRKHPSRPTAAGWGRRETPQASAMLNPGPPGLLGSRKPLKTQLQPPGEAGSLDWQEACGKEPLMTEVECLPPMEWKINTDGRIERQ